MSGLKRQSGTLQLSTGIASIAVTGLFCRLEEKRQELNERYVASLMDRYEIVIEDEPTDESTDGPPGVAEASR